MGQTFACVDYFKEKKDPLFYLIAVHKDLDRPVEGDGCELVDLVGHGGGEEERLPRPSAGFHNLFHLLQETLVQHAI
jgi:hypothetical protein